VVERDADAAAALEEVAEGHDLRLRERRRAAVRLAGGVRAGAPVVVAPEVAVVAVEVHAAAPAAVDAAVLPPHPAAVGVRRLVVDVAVGVEDGDDEEAAAV